MTEEDEEILKDCIISLNDKVKELEKRVDLQYGAINQLHEIINSLIDKLNINNGLL